MRAVGFADVVDAADVWMVEGCDGPRLALEARAQARIVCDVARKNLDRDDPVKSSVSALYTSPMPPAPLWAVIS